MRITYRHPVHSYVYCYSMSTVVEDCTILLIFILQLQSKTHFNLNHIISVTFNMTLNGVSESNSL